MKKYGPIEDFDITNPEHSDPTKYEVVEWEHKGKGATKVEIAKSFEEDSKRRDLTINAMGFDAAGRLKDFHGGLSDLRNKTLRTVGNPDERFAEDALRLQRSIRFAARLGFKISPETMSAIRKNAHTIKNISPERVKDELFKMATQPGPKFADAILKLDRSGLLIHILPELKALQGFRENPKWHPEVQKRSGTVFDHVIEAIKKNPIPDPIINLAIAFHDLGKGRTYEYSEKKRSPTYNAHDLQSIRLIDKIAKRLKFSNDETEALKFAAEHHMKFGKLGEMKPSKVVNLIKNKHFEILKHTAKADDSSRMSLWDPERWNQTIELIDKIEKQWAEQVKRTGNKIVDGSHIMKLLNIKPGKIVGQIKNEVEEWAIDNNVVNSDEIDKKIREVYKNLAS